MKVFFAALKPAFFAMIGFTILLGVIYPMIILGIGQFLFPHAANGSLFYDRNHQIRGSELIGQNFISSKYFHPRPSSAGKDGYDASHSSGSNLGSTSQKLIDVMKKRVSSYRLVNNLSSETAIPVDAVTSSGSGLDPHISSENARLQAPRIATIRGFDKEIVLLLIEKYTEGRTWGFIGEERVNVLKLNLALDETTR